MTSPTARDLASAEATDFIRFCYRRRRSGWPEIYDEMCAVAARGLYKGWSRDELAQHGLTFSLSGMPALAALVRQVLLDESPVVPIRTRGRVAVPIVTDEVADARASVPPVAPAEPSDPGTTLGWSEPARSPDAPAAASTSLPEVLPVG